MQPGILDRIGRHLCVEIHEPSLTLRWAVSLAKMHGEHADDRAAAGNERGAVAGAKAGLSCSLSIRREDGICFNILDHNLTTLLIGGSTGTAARRHPRDMFEECFVEAATDSELEPI